VMALAFAYMASFGVELAVVSVLPTFFEETFFLKHDYATLVASCYPILNIVSRPAGGWIGDLKGRKMSLLVTLYMAGFGYIILAQVRSSWSLGGAIFVCMFTALFAEAACGATFAITPLVSPSRVGQITGIVGGVGNAGSLWALTFHQSFGLNPGAVFYTGAIFCLCSAVFATFVIPSTYDNIKHGPAPSMSSQSQLTTNEYEKGQVTVDLANQNTTLVVANPTR